MDMPDESWDDLRVEQDRCERAWEERNQRKHCAICGKPIGASDRYELYQGQLVVCSKKCAWEALTKEDIDSIVDEFIDEGFKYGD